MRALIALVSAVVLTSVAAQADWHHHHHETYYGPTAPYEPFHPIEPLRPLEPFRPFEPVYHADHGHWNHGWHENRLGWWWVNGLAWEFHSSPTYIYAEPPPPPVEHHTTIIYQSAPAVYAPAPAPAPSTDLPATPVNTAPIPGSQTPPDNGMYYFCESSQLYYPYARSCSERWKTVPQAPVH